MKKTVVFIDESGTLPDIKDKVIVIAAVGTTSPEIIGKIIKFASKKGKLRRQTGELKFYTAGNKTKLSFFKSISSENLDIFVLIVEKLGRKIPDTPEHFAVLCGLLLNDLLSFYSEIAEVIFDKHFSRSNDIEKFNKFLTNFLLIKLHFTHVDSKKDNRVNIADMIAGAVLANETGKSTEFYGMLEKRIISEKRLNWIEAKRKYLANKKLA